MSKQKRAGMTTIAAQPANTDMTAEQRHRMIAEAAYYLALRRGEMDGTPEQDWYLAEAQIERELARGTRAT